MIDLLRLDLFINRLNTCLYVYVEIFNTVVGASRPSRMDALATTTSLLASEVPTRALVTPKILKIPGRSSTQLMLLFESKRS